jgi:cytochrome P450
MEAGLSAVDWLGPTVDYSHGITRFLVSCAQELGPVVHLTPSVTLLSDPDDIQFVLQQTGESFSVTQSFLGEPASPIAGDPWSAGRRATYIGLRAAIDDIAMPAIQDAFDQLAREWPNEPVHDCIVRLERMTSSIIGRICFGDAGASIIRSAGRLLATLTAGANGSLGASQDRLRVERCEREFRVGIRSIVERRIRENSVEDLSGILGHSDRAGLGLDLATRMLASVVLAGYGVPATALAWTMFLLGKHPEEKAKVADEVGRPHAISLKAQLPATEAVVREALRLYPPTWLLARRLQRDERIRDERYLQGHEFLVSSYVTGRDAAHFVDPTRFVPERWTVEGFRESLPKCAYFPFGVGPRHCLGQHLAMWELKLLTALLVRDLNLELLDGDRVRLNSIRGLRPANLVLVANRDSVP